MKSLYTELRCEYIAEWRCWYRMHQLCRNNERYYVECNVCPEWHDESGFIAWFDHMGPRPSPDHIVSRHNKFEDFTPENTSWQTRADSFKTSRYRMRELKQQAEQNGISAGTFYARMRNGWSVQEAVQMPASYSNQKLRRTT